MRKIKVLCHTFHPVAFDGLICSLNASYPNDLPWLLERPVREREKNVRGNFYTFQLRFIKVCMKEESRFFLQNQ